MSSPAYLGTGYSCTSSCSDVICQTTLGSAVTAGGPLKWQSASTAEGEGGSRNSEGDEGGALADHGARMVQGGLHHAGIGGGILQDHARRHGPPSAACVATWLRAKTILLVMRSLYV